MAATFPTSPTNGQTAVVGGVSFVYDSTAGVWNQLQSASSTPTLTSPTINTSVSGTAIKDEDTMSSDSATALATQQSIKAYVDTSISSFSTTLSGLTDTTISTPSSGQVLKYNGSAWINDTDAGGIASLVQDTSPQLGANLDVNGFAISWGDNEKARFGNADDLAIYHDGSNSYIKEEGTGNLLIQGNGTAVIIEDTAGNNNVVAYPNGATTLSYGGSSKLQTTSTGVNVTGTLTATAFSGDGSALSGILTLQSNGSLALPTATSDPTSPSAGHTYVNTSTKELRIYNGSDWADIDISGLGTSSQPATSGVQLYNAGKPSGYYYISVSGQTTYRMYVDNDRNGGGWVLAARVTISSNQAHHNSSAVNLSGTDGPQYQATSTAKVSDAWMNAYRSASPYTGSTAYWMETTGGFTGSSGTTLNNFIDSNATVDLVNAASNQNERTRVALTFEGSFSDRNPNSGTRGFGDHHTGSSYFAYQRHPEAGDQSGFRNDSYGASDGNLWIK
jgi:hypothetical protein